MNPVEEFKKLESGDFGFFIFAICGSVCPGILAIWLYNPELIALSTTPKLVILAVSIMLPYIALNSWIIGMTTGVPASTPKEKIYIQLFMQAAVWSMGMFFICIFFRFFCAISLNVFVILLIVEEIVFLVLQLGKSKTVQHQNQSDSEAGTKTETTDKNE